MLWARAEGGSTGLHLKQNTETLIIMVICTEIHVHACCCIATFLNSACAVAVVHLKVTEVRGNFVEDECYQMATEFPLRPDISVTCA